MGFLPRMRKEGYMMGIVVGIPLLIFFLWFVVWGQRSGYRDKEIILHKHVLNLAAEIESLLGNQMRLLEHTGFFAVEAESVRNVNSEAIKEFLASHGDIAEIAVVNSRGKEITHQISGPHSVSVLADRSQNIEFLSVKDKGYYFGNIYLSQGGPVMLIGRAIGSDGTSIRGAIFGLFKADRILAMLKEAAGEKGASAFIVNERGIIIAHPMISYISEAKDVSRNSAVKLAINHDTDPVRVYANDLTEQVVGTGTDLIVSSPVGERISTGWFVITETPASIAFAGIAGERSKIVWWFLAVIVTISTGLILWMRHMKKSLSAVAHAFGEINRGNLNLSLPDTDEWRAIASGFHALAETLKRASNDLAREHEAVVKERNKFELALSEISDAVIGCDHRGAVILANRPAQELIGYGADKMVGRHIGDIVRLFEDDAPISLTDYMSVRKSHSIVPVGKRGNLRLITAQDQERLVYARVGLFRRSDDASHGGCLLVLHDLTHEKFIEKVKADFVAITAHELRTPLTEVKWATSLLMGNELGSLTRKQKNILKRSAQSTEHMVRLVDDLLETAMMETGETAYSKAPCDIKAITKALYDMHKKAADRNGISLIFKKPARRLPSMLADEAALKIAINNILENALTYTPKGGTVTVSVGKINPALDDRALNSVASPESYAVTPRQDHGVFKSGVKNDSMIEVRVADTGIGIRPEDMDEVYTKFFRGKNARAMETEGTGLGLYVTKKIIESHGGSVEVESILDKGSTFSISLPVHAA